MSVLDPSPSPALRWVGAVVGIGVVIAACGEPTAQIIHPDDSPVSFVLPAEYADITEETGEGQSLVYGLPSTPLDSLSSEPVVLVDTLPSGQNASFSSLRELSTFGEFDPLDPDLETLPNDTQVLGYLEIVEPEIWGIRLRMAIGQGASDFQALVDRASGQVVVTRVICTQACFLEKIDLIDDIQGSWSLEP
ncbi:MAG: hypothetical protein OEV40_18995 [Acidimicrobiia bacterium]|nr:hypothetical protein [Acidimicrobiia bacterium]